MTKYRYRWPIIIGVSIAMWVGIVYAVKAEGINGISEAAIYSIDQSVCGLKVDPNWTIDAITRASKESGVDAKTAVDAYTIATQELWNVIVNKPYKDVVAYCAARTAR